MSGTAAISGAVEGIVDEAVVRRLLQQVGAVAGPIHGRKGKAALRQQLRGYNNAARLGPWLVLVDLDQDSGCAPPFRASWLPDPAPLMCFRVAVREVEAWLLADRERIAHFLGVALSKVPHDPDALKDPKRAVVDLARQSRRAEVREDMVPRPGSRRSVGSAYASRLIEYAEDAQDGWRPEIAAQASNSLCRCLERLREMVKL